MKQLRMHISWGNFPVPVLVRLRLLVPGVVCTTGAWFEQLVLENILLPAAFLAKDLRAAFFFDFLTKNYDGRWLLCLNRRV